MTAPIWTHPSIVSWSQLLLDSFHHWIGRDLLERNGSPTMQAQALFDSPFVVISHGTESDPILNYANQAGLDLWEMTWEQLIRTPSRQTAEPVNQEERIRMLVLAEEQGYFEGYRGVRISETGRRFLVVGATVWNVLDHQSRRVGQAATFSNWSEVP
ncbi:MAG: MEKHLA domain-containing protein [Nitrospiraceae bacterium]